MVAASNIDDEETEEYFRRIVSCVNALAGYNPAALAALVEAAEQVEENLRLYEETGQRHHIAYAYDSISTALTAFREGSSS